MIYLPCYIGKEQQQYITVPKTGSRVCSTNNNPEQVPT